LLKRFGLTLNDRFDDKDPPPDKPVPAVIVVVFGTLELALSFTVLRIPAVAARDVDVDVTVLLSWTIPFAVVEALGRRAVFTVPVEIAEAFNWVNWLPLPMNPGAVNVPDNVPPLR
jgi:hypothetical protein